MKILDATIIIAIFNEINCPDLIDKILELGHELIIPSHVMKKELLNKSMLKVIEKFVKQEKIQILKKNSIEEIRKFQKKHQVLGLGECDVMLSYQKLNCDGNNVYCILDDRKARTKASNLNIKFIGLIGLLRLMEDRNIMTSDEIQDITTRLKNSSFRFPTDVVI